MRDTDVDKHQLIRDLESCCDRATAINEPGIVLCLLDAIDDMRARLVNDATERQELAIEMAQRRYA